MSSSRFVLLAFVLAACTPSVADSGTGGGGTTCTSAASGSCPADQPSLVTCPAGVSFDAGELTCTTTYLEEDPGQTAFCCGSCAFASGSPSCEDGGGELVTCPAGNSYDTEGCTPLFDASADTSSSRQWCCPAP